MWISGKGEGLVAREDGLKLQIRRPESGSPWKRESHPVLVSRFTHGEGEGPWSSGGNGTLVRAELAAARRLQRPDPSGFQPDAGSELFRGDAGPATSES